MDIGFYVKNARKQEDVGFYFKGKTFTFSR